MNIQSVSTDIELGKSRSYNVIAAEFNVTKGEILRAALYYALTHKADFVAWVKENGVER